MQSLTRVLLGVLMTALSLARSSAAEAALTKVAEFPGYENASQNAGLIEGPDRRFYGWISHAGQERRSVLWRMNRDGSESTILHTFTGLGEGGENPSGLLYGSDGSLYGVANDQQGLGRIFAMAADGTAYRVIKQFDAVTDRTSSPFGLIEARDHRLYGVTGTGGPNGLLYGINKDGSGFEILHRFGSTRTDGQFPRGNLLEDGDGTLYGVTASDRTSFLGTVYRVGKAGAGYEIIHQFSGGGQGSLPSSGLVLGTDGFIYGQTDSGGPNNIGGIFKLKPDGSDFEFLPTGTGGCQWYRSVAESSDGNLYAIRPGGGPQFNGVLFRMHNDGTGLETLHEFQQSAEPSEGVRPKQLLHASDGFLYFITYLRSPVPIASLTVFTPLLMRYGPVPLPPTSPAETLVITSSRVGSGPTAGFKLSFTGQAGRVYDIEYTNAFPPDWRIAQQITADAQGTVEFTEEGSVSLTTRFFRATSR